jgi:hypothetical protein
MNNPVRTGAAALACAALLGACASKPKSIDAAYVTPTKYEDLSCDQIAHERTAVEYRAQILHRTLKKRATGDALKMGVGAALFLPTLFFIKGNGAKAAEFAHLKGDYAALRINAEQRGCGIAFRDVDHIADGPPVRRDAVAIEKDA